MSKPIFHAKNSARRYGGKWEDYFPVHDLMDSSKGAFPDNRHRALTHTSFFLKEILEKIHMPEHNWHGPVLINSDGKEVSVRQIGEDHIQEDFRGVIPTAQDFIENVDIQPWMNDCAGGQYPPSHRKIAERRRIRTITVQEAKAEDAIHVD